MGKDRPEYREARQPFQSWIPPLYDEAGELMKDRYKITINRPGAPEERHACASEWGMMGWVDDAVRKVGENGKRQVHITLTVEPGEKTGILGETTEYADATEDLQEFASRVRLLGEIIGLFYSR